MPGRLTLPKHRPVRRRPPGRCHTQRPQPILRRRQVVHMMVPMHDQPRPHRPSQRIQRGIPQPDDCSVLHASPAHPRSAEPKNHNPPARSPSSRASAPAPRYAPAATRVPSAAHPPAIHHDPATVPGPALPISAAGTFRPVPRSVLPPPPSHDHATTGRRSPDYARGPSKTATSPAHRHCHGSQRSSARRYRVTVAARPTHPTACRTAHRPE